LPSLPRNIYIRSVFAAINNNSRSITAKVNMQFTTLAVVAASALAVSAGYGNGTVTVTGTTTSLTYCPSTTPVGTGSSYPVTATWTTYPVSSYPISSYPVSTYVPSGSVVPPPSNGTATATVSGSKTPVGPTGSSGTPTPPATGGAVTNGAGSALAVVGLAIAYFL